MGVKQVASVFKELGGEFVDSPQSIRKSLERIRVWLFDWDGVFNTGMKSSEIGSPFAEEDSMGVNLLRLGYWLRNGKTMPMAGIITGASNQGALYFARRESIDVCIRGFTDKRISWNHLLETFDVRPAEVAYVFDDVLDIPIAMDCGLRFCVQRTSSPGFLNFLKEKHLVDYITANKGGHGAVREVAELGLMLLDLYHEVIQVRSTYDDAYAEYLARRNAIETYTFTPADLS